MADPTAKRRNHFVDSGVDAVFKTSDLTDDELAFTIIDVDGESFTVKPHSEVCTCDATLDDDESACHHGDVALEAQTLENSDTDRSTPCDTCGYWGITSQHHIALVEFHCARCGEFRGC